MFWAALVVVNATTLAGTGPDDWYTYLAFVALVIALCGVMSAAQARRR